jgi:hypothetical protein
MQTTTQHAAGTYRVHFPGGYVLEDAAMVEVAPGQPLADACRADARFWLSHPHSKCRADRVVYDVCGETVEVSL